MNETQFAVAKITEGKSSLYPERFGTFGEAAAQANAKGSAEPGSTFEVEMIYKGFTQAQMKEAFDRVSNPDDWKAEILCTCPGEAVMLVTAAIEFYTATVPFVSLNTRNMDYIISSEGYRKGPAGDH